MFFDEIARYFTNTTVEFVLPENQLRAFSQKINKDPKTEAGQVLLGKFKEHITLTGTSVLIHPSYATMLLNDAIGAAPADLNIDLIAELERDINPSSITEPEMAQMILLGLLANDFYAIFFSRLKKLPLEDESMRCMIACFIWDEISLSDEKIFTEGQLSILIERLSQHNAAFSPAIIKAILESEPVSDDFSLADLERYRQLFSERIVLQSRFQCDATQHPLYARAGGLMTAMVVEAEAQRFRPS